MNNADIAVLKQQLRSPMKDLAARAEIELIRLGYTGEIHKSKLEKRPETTWKKVSWNEIINVKATEVYTKCQYHTVVFYGVEVLTIDEANFKVTLRNEGNTSKTTKERIMQAGNLFHIPIQLNQVKGRWIISVPIAGIKGAPFEDGMSFLIPEDKNIFRNVPDYIRKLSK